mgnify:FL=1
MTKLWGGRFNKPTDKLVEEFTKSIHFDYKLAEYDILGSLAHVRVLKEAGYLTSLEAKKLTQSLHALGNSIKNHTYRWDPSCEDIHTDIQNKLEKRVGKLVLKLHTARSRNEQVVLATKWYALAQFGQVDYHLKEMIDTLNHLAKKNASLIIPGFTHLQPAQPVYLKDHLSAYIQMFKRDQQRIKFLTMESDGLVLTMGSGALAGTPIPSKKYSIAGKEFGIRPTVNSLDAVSDRDFVIEIIGALSIVAMHLSRLAEDLILWSTKEFDFIELDESFCTGSSLMPQKKNPDVLELIRGYAGRLYGNLFSVLTMMKGLPLTYNRDMQLDKEPLFNSFEIVLAELNVLQGLISTLKFNEARLEELLKDESLYATDLVYYLVKKGVAFTEAHTIIGKLVNRSIETKIFIKDMKDNDLSKFSDKLVKKEILGLFDPEVSVKSKISIKRE